MRPGAVQIAGVHDADEAAMLAACGVDLVGIPLRLDHHAEDLSDDAARDVVAATPGVEWVLITYLTSPDEITALAHRIGAGWVQLHGPVEPDAVAALRRRAPALRLAKSLVVRGDDLASLERLAERHTPFVDAFLTDTFDPRTGASGATGRVHDWSISRALATRLARPLVLAGGLTPDNVGDAIRAVGPAAVDAHTGVEGLDGRKDRTLVARFVAEARAAFAQRARGT